MIETTFVAFVVVDVFELEVGIKAFVQCRGALVGDHEI